MAAANATGHQRCARPSSGRSLPSPSTGRFPRQRYRRERNWQIGKEDRTPTQAVSQPPRAGQSAPTAAPLAAHMPIALPFFSPFNVESRIARLHQHRRPDALDKTAAQQHTDCRRDCTSQRGTGEQGRAHYHKPAAAASRFPAAPPSSDNALSGEQIRVDHLLHPSWLRSQAAADSRQSNVGRWIRLRRRGWMPEHKSLAQAMAIGLGSR